MGVCIRSTNKLVMSGGDFVGAGQLLLDAESCYDSGPKGVSRLAGVCPVSANSTMSLSVGQARVQGYWCQINSGQQ
jgi:hypothetical protein